MLGKLNKKRGQRGFTLIELMIVVAIVGILAAIAIPNFLRYQCKARQSEAKSLLGAIRTNQEAYYAEYDTYTTSLASAGFATKGDAKYSYTSTGGTTYTATATGKSGTGVAGDAWTMTSGGTLTNTANACS